MSEEKKSEIQVAPLHLESYFVTQLNVVANLSYEPSKPTTQNPSDFKVESEMGINSDERTKYRVRLKVAIQPGEGSNIPYSLTVEIIGFLRAQSDLDQTKIDRVVNMTANSMLYGAMREVVRNVTAMGPYPAVLLPLVMFPSPKIEKEEVEGKIAEHKKAEKK